MRLYITIIILIFLVDCSPDSRQAQNKVIPPARLKAIIEQSVEGRGKAEPGKPIGQTRTDIRSQKQRSYKNQQIKVVIVTSYKQADSTRVKNIESLRASGINPDFSEPLNKDLARLHSSDTLFQSAISLSNDRILKIGFDNDIFDYTDQFYTNGIQFDYVAPAISANPLKYILLPYWGRAKNYYGLSLVQNLYTPSTTKLGGILYGDRPYAAYLYIGSFKITNDEQHHFRQRSEFDIGVIGKPSLGGAVQDLFHKYVPTNSEPLGWDYQVGTDALLSYNFSLEKGVINTKHLQLILAGSGSLGTLYDNIGGCASLRIGWFNDYFSDLGVRKKRVLKASGCRLAQYFLTFRGAARLVAYDATLEGGMINCSSPYTIPASSVSSVVAQSSVGFTVTYGTVGIELEQTILSPEFNHRWWHAWGHIGLLFAL
jgi:hypothetical protein